MKSEPLCTVEYCPRPADPDWHRCWCGNAVIEHHHVEPRGMGGSDERKFDPDNVIALCHFHHEMVTKHRWRDTIKDGVYEMYGPNGGLVVSKRLNEDFFVPRPYSAGGLADLVDELRHLPDDDLVAFSRQQHLDATQAYIRHCAAIYAYREKYKSYGEAWSEQGEGLFGYASRTLRRDALFCTRLLTWNVTATEQEQELASEISDRQLKLVAQSNDFKTALDIAINYQAETGSPEPYGLARRLQDEGVLPRASYSYRCPNCEHEAPLKEFRVAKP